MLIPNAPALSEMSEGLATIPEATYNLKVHKAEYVGTPKSADAKGPYIKAQLIVTGPGFTADPANPNAVNTEAQIGRLVFMNYSLTGDGSFRLRELLAVTNHPADYRLADSDELLGLEFRGVVVIQKGTNGYPDKNEVKRHMPLL